MVREDGGRGQPMVKGEGASSSSRQPASWVAAPFAPIRRPQFGDRSAHGTRWTLMGEQQEMARNTS